MRRCRAYQAYKINRFSATPLPATGALNGRGFQAVRSTRNRRDARASSFFNSRWLISPRNSSSTIPRESPTLRAHLASASGLTTVMEIVLVGILKQVDKT